MGCMRSCQLCGSSVPFHLTGRGGWLSLSGKGEGIGTIATTIVVLHCYMGTCCATLKLTLLTGLFNARDNPVWGRPRGRPRNSWLMQVDKPCREALDMGRVPAWRLAWRNPQFSVVGVCDDQPPTNASTDCLIDSSFHFHLHALFILRFLLFLL